MGSGVVRGLYQHQDLFQQFKTDPLGALAELERRTGANFRQINRNHIAVIQSMTLDDFKALIDISDKVRSAGSEYFKLG
jgi:hypothetical protein